MSLRSKFRSKKSPVREAVYNIAEALEQRAYLTGFVLGSPVNTTTASVGLSPVFANLYPFVTGSTKADLFVANSTNSVSVLISNGDGSFSTNVDTIPVAGTPLPLAVGDFNGDGVPDIVAGTTGNPYGDISIILGNGNGTFQAAENIPALNNNQAIAVAAFVNGGPEDVITVSNSASNVNNAAIIFLNANGTSKSVNPFSLPFGSVSAVATGDFNGDGNQDFAVLNQANNSISVFLGNGNGTFQQSQSYSTGPGTSPTSLAVGDFRNKTINSVPELDIVTADSTSGEVSFLANNGNGTFAAPTYSAVAGSPQNGGPLKVRLADLNHDGIPDLIALLSPGGSGEATCLLGNGDGTFHTGAVIDIPGGDRNAIAAGDLVGASTPLTDLVLTNSTQITALLNITAGDRTVPTAMVTSTPPAGSTSSTTFDFTVTYADSQQIDASTINNNNLTVTFPDGVTTQAATLVSTGLGNAASVEATYSISFASNLTSADQGTYQVSMNAAASSVTNAGGVQVNSSGSPAAIGSFTLAVQNSNVDTTPPTASITSAPVGSSSSNLYQFTVTYSDNVAVEASTISSNNLIVTFPNSSTQAATLVSTGLTNGASVQAIYQITFPANLATSNEGTYGVSMNADAVTDTSNNPVASGSIGTFSLSVSTVPPPGPTGDFTVGAPIGKILTSVVTGSKQGSLAVHVTNNGTGTVSGPVTGTVVVTLYYSDSAIHDSSSMAVATVTHKVKKLKVGKGFVVHFKQFKYPLTANTYYLIADASLNGTLDSTDGASSPITVAQAFVHGVAKTVTTTKSTLVAGTKYTAFLVLENVGNIAYNGPATVGVAALPPGGTSTSIVAAPVPIKVSLKPSQTKKFKVTFVPTNLPISGSDYSLVLTINIPGDSSATSATSAAVLTI